MNKPKQNKKLTVKQRKFVAEVVKGTPKSTAYMKVYEPKTKNMNSIYRQANEVSRKPLVQHAIDNALEMHGATPEFAVGNLKYIAEQREELGASRLANMNILELHGYNKGQSPTITLDIQNASFFNSARTQD